MGTTAVSVTGIDATYYLVKDIERASAFYRDKLGLTPTFEIPGSLTEFTFGGGETFGLYKIGDPHWHSSSGVMFAVPDVGAAVTALKELGVSFEDEITETPVCFMAFGEDSEGNGFILHQRKTGC